MYSRANASPKAGTKAKPRSRRQREASRTWAGKWRCGGGGGLGGLPLPRSKAARRDSVSTREVQHRCSMCAAGGEESTYKETGWAAAPAAAACSSFWPDTQCVLQGVSCCPSTCDAYRVESCSCLTHVPEEEKGEKQAQSARRQVEQPPAAPRLPRLAADEGHLLSSPRCALACDVKNRCVFVERVQRHKAGIHGGQERAACARLAHPQPADSSHTPAGQQRATLSQAHPIPPAEATCICTSGCA